MVCKPFHIWFLLSVKSHLNPGTWVPPVTLHTYVPAIQTYVVLIPATGLLHSMLVLPELSPTTSCDWLLPSYDLGLSSNVTCSEKTSLLKLSICFPFSLLHALFYIHGNESCLAFLVYFLSPPTRMWVLWEHTLLFSPAPRIMGTR